MPIQTAIDSINQNQGSPFGFKNRIINGAMVIDQRNAGASITPTVDSYSVDRWQLVRTQASKVSLQQNAGAVTPPTGFSNYLGVTSLSAYAVTATDYFCLSHYIEGFNFFDMAWGTASAATVTLSFWVRSSLTGTFGAALENSAETRSYPFTYSISVANTWEQKNITVAGDTSGTWIGATNGIGLTLRIGLGAGATYSGTSGAWAATRYLSATGGTSVVATNGATFYITGVQLEKGSTATSFDYRPYGTELQLAQRYYEKSATQYFARGDVNSVTHYTPFFFKTTKRATPNSVTLSLGYGGTGSGGAAVNSMADGFEFLYSVGATASSSYAAVVYAADAEL